ncbi:MAG: hypothetical protein ABSE16_08770 [Verrucomicrobiota bacterium]|jgi:hypothetical protein
MKTHPNLVDSVLRFGISTGVLLLGVTAKANPISLPEKPVTTEISVTIAIAILLEVICVWLILRHSRRPRLFILWLIGMHLLTYPSFLGLLWFLQDMRPAFAVAGGEGLVVVVEGALIYLLCRFVLPVKPELAAPSIGKCWLASLAGNICSAVAFPILLALYDRFISV